MPISVGLRTNKQDLLASAGKLRELILAEAQERNVDVEVVVDEVTRGDKSLVQLLINDQPITISGVLPTEAGPSFVIDYGVEGHLGVAHWGVLHQARKDEKSGRVLVGEGQIYDPYALFARAVVEGIEEGKTPLEAIVSGTRGTPAPIVGAYATTPESGLRRIAAGASLAGPSEVGSQELINAFLMTPERYQAAPRANQEAVKHFLEATRRNFAYRSASHGTNMTTVTMTPFYGPRGGDIPKSIKGSTLGTREMAIPLVARFDEKGRQLRVDENAGIAYESGIVLPWETGPRIIRDTSKRHEGTMQVLYAPVPGLPGGAYATGEVVTRGGKGWKEIFGLPFNPKVKLEGITDLPSMVQALSSTDVVERLKATRGRIFQPGSRLRLGVFGDAEIAFTHQKTAFTIMDLALEVPKYFNVQTSRFATAAEALTPEGELRPEYRLTREALQQRPSLRPVLEQITIAETIGATPRLQARGYYEVSSSFKTSGAKAGFSVVPFLQAQPSSDVAGAQPFYLDVVTGDVKKPWLMALSSIGARIGQLNWQLRQMEQSGKVPASTYAQLVGKLHSTWTYLAESAKKVGIDLESHTTWRTLRVPGSEKEIRVPGLVSLAHLDDNKAAALGTQILDDIREMVLRAGETPEARYAMARDLYDIIGITYLPRGTRLHGLPGYEEETAELMRQSAALVGEEEAAAAAARGDFDVAGYLFANVPRSFTAEFYGKATINLPTIFGLATYGAAGQLALRSLGYDLTEQGMANFLLNMREHEAPATRAWRSILAGGLIMAAPKRGLEIDSSAVVDVPEEIVGGLLQRMSAEDTEEAGLKAAEEYLLEKGIKAPLLRIGNVVLPRPGDILSIGHFTEEGRPVGRMISEYTRTLTAVAEGGGTAENVYEAVASFYESQISKLSSKRIGQLFGGFETQYGFSARYEVSDYLKPYEAYIPTRQLAKVIRRYGYEPSQILGMINRAGLNLYTHLVREPNPGAFPLFGRVVTPRELYQRIYQKTLADLREMEGDQTPDHILVKRARRLTAEVMRGMERTIQLGRGLAVRGVGDFDEDPVTATLILPRDESGRVPRDPRRLYKEMSRIQRVIQPEIEREAAGVDALMEEMAPANLKWLLNEMSKSFQDYQEDLEKMGKPLKGPLQEVTPEALAAANIQWSGSKIAMGLTYNARRTLLFSGSAMGYPVSILRRIHRGTMAAYQYAIDLSAQQRTFVETLTGVFANRPRTRLHAETDEDRRSKQFGVWGSGGRAVIEEGEWKAALEAHGGDVTKAFRAVAGRMYRQLAGHLVRATLPSDKEEDYPTVSPEAAAALLAGGTSYGVEEGVDQATAFYQHEMALDELAARIEGALTSKNPRRAMHRIVDEVAREIGDEAIRTPLFAAFMTGAFEQMLDPRTATNEFRAERAAVIQEMLSAIASGGDDEIRELFTRWGAGAAAALIKKGRFTNALGYLLGRATRLGYAGILEKVMTGSIGITNVRQAEREVNALLGGPEYLSARDLAALISDEGFESNKASILLRTLQRRLPELAGRLDPRKVFKIESKAMRTGREREGIISMFYIRGLGGVYAGQIGLRGRFGTTDIKGYLDYMRLDEHGNVIIGDIKVGRKAPFDNPMYQAQVGLYQVMLRDAARNDEAWGDVAEQLRRQGWVEEDIERAREALRSGDVRAELTWLNTKNVKEIEERVQSFMDAGVLEDAEFTSSALSDLIEQREISVDENALRNKAAERLVRLSTTPTSELAQQAIQAVRRVEGRFPNAILRPDIFPLLGKIANSQISSGARMVMGLMGLSPRDAELAKIALEETTGGGAVTQEVVQSVMEEIRQQTEHAQKVAASGGVSGSPPGDTPPPTSGETAASGDGGEYWNRILKLLEQVVQRMDGTAKSIGELTKHIGDMVSGQAQQGDGGETSGRPIYTGIRAGSLSGRTAKVFTNILEAQGYAREFVGSIFGNLPEEEREALLSFMGAKDEEELVAAAGKAPHRLVNFMLRRSTKTDAYVVALAGSEEGRKLLRALQALGVTDLEAVMTRPDDASVRDVRQRLEEMGINTDEAFAIGEEILFSNQYDKGAGANISARELTRLTTEFKKRYKELSDARTHALSWASQSPYFTTLLEDYAQRADEFLRELGIDVDAMEPGERLGLARQLLASAAASGGAGMSPEQVARLKSYARSAERLQKTKAARVISKMTDEQWEALPKDLREALADVREPIASLPGDEEIKAVKEILPDELRKVQGVVAGKTRDLADKLGELSEATKQLTEEFRNTRRVSSTTRERYKNALMEVFKAQIERERARAEYERRAAEYEAEMRPDDPDVAKRLIQAEHAYQRTMKETMVREGQLEEEVNRLVEEETYPAGRLTEVLSSSMRSMIGSWGLFYMSHLLRMPINAMAGGFAQQERASEIARLSIMGARYGFAPSSIVTYSGMVEAMKESGASPYGPIYYELERVFGGESPFSAMGTAALAGPAITAFAMPSLLRIAGAASGSMLSASAIASITGMSMLVAAPVAAAGALALYTHGLRANPRSQYAYSAALLRRARGEDVEFSKDANIFLYGEDALKWDAIHRVMAMEGTLSISRDEAERLAASPLTLSEEELDKYSKKARQEIAPRVLYYMYSGAQERDYAGLLGVKRPEQYTKTVTIHTGYGTPYHPTAGVEKTVVSEEAAEFQAEMERSALGYAEALAQGAPYEEVARVLYGRPVSGAQTTYMGMALWQAEKRRGESAVPIIREGFELLSRLPSSYRRELLAKYMPRGGRGGTPERYAAEAAIEAASALGGLTSVQRNILAAYVQTREDAIAMGYEPFTELPGIEEIQGMDERDLVQAQITQAQMQRRRRIFDTLTSVWGWDVGRAGGFVAGIQNFRVIERAMGGDIYALTSLAQQGVLPSSFQIADVNMQGQVTGLPLFTTSMRGFGQSPEQIAAWAWGANWQATDVSGVRTAMVSGYQTPWGDTYYGLRAAQMYMDDLRWQASQASVGISRQRLALQWAFTTGEGLSAYGVGQPFRWSIPGIGSYNAGPGIWGYQEATFELGVAQQRWQMDLAQQRFNLTEQFWQRGFGLNYTQFMAQQDYMQGLWGLQDQQRALGFKWRMEDLREARMFASGRERRLIERRIKRESVMHDLQQEQVEKSREYQEELWRLQERRFRLEREQHNAMRRLQEESLRRQREFFEERVRLQRQYQELQRRYFQEQHKLQQRAIGIQQHYNEMLRKAQQDVQRLRDRTDEALAKLLRVASLNDDFWKGLEDALQELIRIMQGDIAGGGSISGGGGASGTPGGDSGGGRTVPYAAGGPILPDVELHDGELIMTSRAFGWVVPREAAQDVFDHVRTTTESPNAQGSSGGGTIVVDVTIGTEDLRQIVRRIIVEELGPVGGAR